jgi:hypothetical protein
LICIDLFVVEIIFQDEKYQVVLNGLELSEMFGCDAFGFSCGFVLSKGPNRPKFGGHSPSQTLSYIGSLAELNF